jgi:glyoxylase-like metal-dependent hydrolase (beta-lactamase superfamily II)
MANGSWRIGAVSITRVVEIEASGGLRRVLPQAQPEAVREIGWLHPHFIDDEGRLKGAIQALAVQTPDRRIIVDTCVGNDKHRPERPAWNMLQTSFINDLADAGFPPEGVDTVMCTHLHVDHVGWNTRLQDGRWVPTFPNARYLMAERELEHWRSDPADMPQQILADSVRPVFEAGLVDLVPTDHRICDEISLVPTPGHTPGHVSVLIRSAGEQALITGDFVHHPCQIARPDWSSAVDTDAGMAAATRRRIFEQYADTPTLIIGTHFATPTAGRLVRDGDTFRLDV